MFNTESIEILKRGARSEGRGCHYDNISYNISGVWLDVDDISDSFQFDEEEGRLFLVSRFKSAFFLTFLPNYSIPFGT